jgi:flavin-dependent dehydrogenase
MNTLESQYDVVIMGGGLAGLTLSLQLKKRLPSLQILVLERRTHPVPEAAHKVGESSVEIGAHYFDKVLGLGDHLKENQLRKFGFRFFFSEGRRDIDQVTEIGASHHMSVPSYQIDRGIFENFLAFTAQERGIHFLDTAMVRKIELTTTQDKTAKHRIEFEHIGQVHAVSADWVVDACGRAGSIKRKLGLAQANAHDSHAVWFRIKDRIELDKWSDNMAWRERCNPQARWLSTNHLVGAGYWVWLIPLASGSHSVGIVANPAQHPLESMNTFEKSMEWLKTYQPLLFDELDDKRHLLQDFAFFKRFSYGCKQVFSADRWALTGEAGLFLDPFYSPGSDFIAIGNTYITELIELDRRGERIGARAQIFDQTFQSFYESTLALYTYQYPIFGDPEVLPVKVIWDYTYYWGVLAQFFFHERLTDLSVLSQLRSELMQCQKLNLEIQNFLRTWSDTSAKRNPAVMLDQAELPWFAKLNSSLNDRLNKDQFLERIRQSCQQLQQLAYQILAHALSQYPELNGDALKVCLESFGPEDIDAEAMLPMADFYSA